MHKTPFIFFIVLSLIFTNHPTAQGQSKDVSSNAANKNKIALAIHGGAGTIKRGSMDAQQEGQYRSKLKEALDAGYAVLEKEGSALEAVMASVRILEDSPLFNAGKGAVFTHEGKN